MNKKKIPNEVKKVNKGLSNREKTDKPFQTLDDEKVLEIGNKIIERYLGAFKKLAK